jgi:hypothetical protein
VTGPDRGAPAFVDELRALGVPDRLLQRAPAMLRGVFNENGANQRMVWFATPDATFGDKVYAKGTAASVDVAAGHLRALAAVARAGRLVAPVVDLADPTAAGRVDAFLAAARTPLRTVHLSNMLDYVAAPTEVIDAVASLARGGPTTVISSTAGWLPDKRAGDWYTPGVQPLDVWTATDGLRAMFAKMEEVPTRGTMSAETSAFLPSRPWGTGGEPEKKPTPTNAQKRAEGKERIAAHYAVDDLAYDSLVRALGEGRPQKDAVDVAALKRLGVPPPRGPDDVRALVRALRPLFPVPPRAP